MGHTGIARLCLAHWCYRTRTKPTEVREAPTSTGGGGCHSVDVKVNLSRGTECGFFRSGFSYYKVEGQSEQATTLIAVVGDREVYKFGCYSFSWILTHFRLIKSIKVYKETESILNQDENDGDNESKKKE